MDVKKKYNPLLVIWLMMVFLLFANQNGYGQIGYAKDSLQIKVYTEIQYKEHKPTGIEVTHVFCDYCNDKQKEHIKNIAWDLAFNDRFSPENVIEEGKKRLAMYIRIPKDKFILMKDEQRRRR
ncbi:hypothetical protein [Aegicerativicinus sediminis]